ncbi:MAG TPA: DNA polymerase III subunit beta [Syntrophomonadaceae bacterium]|nr:DNA polymerase III subunit beta [Syntrophomonadaceae bacterium]
MKFLIEKNDLSTLTTMVYRAAANRPTIPVLSGLFIQASAEDGLTMTATDMEIGIKASSKQAEIINPGQVLVNANYFSDFIKLLPDTTITVEYIQETAKLQISYGRSCGNINSYSEFEYPGLPEHELEPRFTMPQSVLKEALRKTVFAAAPGHYRQIFTGVLFDFLEDSVCIVASDTHRLAYFTYTLDTEKIEPNRFVIPVRTVNELLRFLEDNDEPIYISVAKNNVVFYTDQFLLLSRLIDGQYPNYQSVIPANLNTSLTLKTQSLTNSLERARVLPTDDKHEIQHVRFNITPDEILLNSHSDMMGEITEVIENISIEGETDVKVAFNTNYFLDVMKIFDQECEEVTVQLSGSLGPAIVKNPEKDHYLYVLVPLRTSY